MQESHLEEEHFAGMWVVRWDGPIKNISGLTLLLDGGVDSKDCSASRSCQTVLSRA